MFEQQQNLGQRFGQKNLVCGEVVLSAGFAM